MGWMSLSLGLSACLVCALSNRVHFISVRGIFQIPFLPCLSLPRFSSSRINSRIHAQIVPLLVSRAAPKALRGLRSRGGERSRRLQGAPAPAALKRTRPEPQPRCPSFLPRIWLLASSLKEHTDLFFFLPLIKSIIYQKIN